MTRNPFDETLIREGRPISERLPELVSDDKAQRFAAAELLGGIWFGLPRYSTDRCSIDWPASKLFAEHQERVKASVRSAVEGNDFPKTEFVERLIDYRIALDEDWRQRVDRMGLVDSRVQGLQDRLLERAILGESPRGRFQAARRFVRLFCASMERDRKLSAEAEGLAVPGIVSSLVFKALDRALLSDRNGLWKMLERGDSLYQEAVEALARIGPPAREFADYLLERLDRQNRAGAYDGAQALASIGQGDATIVDALLKRLRHGSEPVSAAAAAVLEKMGPPLAGCGDEAVALLMEMTRLDADHPQRFNAVGAMASLGRESENVLVRVLDMAAPRPPQWREAEGVPGYRFDLTLAERGRAINSLPYFRRFTDRVVIALLEAFDTFEEYDPDYSYDGERGRVCEALSRLGAAAAPAVHRMIDYLQAWDMSADKEWPKDVFQLLSAVGPAAADALPMLERIRREAYGEESAEPLDEFLPLDHAILTIRAKQ